MQKDLSFLSRWEEMGFHLHNIKLILFFFFPPPLYYAFCQVPVEWCEEAFRVLPSMCQIWTIAVTGCQRLVAPWEGANLRQFILFFRIHVHYTAPPVYLYTETLPI